MSVTPSAEEREQFEQITAAWQEYDRTFAVSTVADYLAEEVLFVPPGGSTVEGKEAALDYLDRPEEDASRDLDQWVENIFVSGDLAVVHVVVDGTVVPDEGEEPAEMSHTGLDVYRRDEGGTWKQIIAMWNDQA